MRIDTYNVTKDDMYDVMEWSISKYPSDRSTKAAWNSFQSRFECCGVTGPRNYFSERQRKDRAYMRSFNRLLKSRVVNMTSNESI